MADTNDDDGLEYVPGKGFRTRLRYGKGLRGRFWIKLSDPNAAKKRAARLRELADALGRAGHSARAPIILEEAGAAVADKDFNEAVEAAEKLCGGMINVPKLAATRTTVQGLGEDWTEGRLHRRFPDQIKEKRSVADDESRLKNYVYPVIGTKLVTAVTLDDAEEIMRRLPDDLAPLTRRGIAALVARIMKLAVYPLRLIAASPIPQGFVPGKGKRKALACLYPDEDRRLLACADVPFSFRLLYGFLTREGMREGEAFSLSWGDLDLTRGAVRLDKNKTDDPRAWALMPGTTAALKAYRKKLSPEPKAADLVFLDPQGQQHSKFGAAELLRSHLRAIKLHEERPELFETTDERRQIRVHDLRGTFVTVALANDRSESWIGDRTGHTSSVMINRYKRAARTFAELGMGDLVPLDAAIPELHSKASGPPPRAASKTWWAKGGPAIANRAKKKASPTGFEPVLQP
jgi:integrase